MKENIVPKYIIHRTVGQLSEEELAGAGALSNKALDSMPDVRWIRSYYSAEEGKVYCEYQAPSLNLLLEHAKRAQLPFDHATVVKELDPAMFR